MPPSRPPSSATGAPSTSPRSWAATPRPSARAGTTWINSPVQIRTETGWSRRSLQVHLEAHGVVTRTIFSGNITRQPMMREVEYRAAPEGYPVADQIMLNGVCLPCHPTMSEELVLMR